MTRYRGNSGNLLPPTVVRPILEPFVLFRSQNVFKIFEISSESRTVQVGGGRNYTYKTVRARVLGPETSGRSPLPAMVVCGGQFVYYLHGYFSAGRTCRQIEPRANFQDPTGRNVTTAVIGGAIGCGRKPSRRMSVVLTYVSPVNSPYIYIYILSLLGQGR